ncbi:MAG TPA: glycogen synthase [Steroidobacteraceae bacterium]|nr:glycogen synthase [Steroidobacteraceae bacterium]
MRIAFVASEFTPLAKTGGLADVSSALTRFLHRSGVDVRPFMPLYSRIDRAALALVPVEFLKDVPIALGAHRYRFDVLTGKLPNSDLPMYFIDCPVLYGRAGIYSRDADEHLRFLLLTRAAIECCQRMGFAPDIFHCNDWHTAFAPLFLKSMYGWDKIFARTKSVLTIHNVGYQGVFAASARDDLGLGAGAHLLHQDDLALGRINSLKHGVMYADSVTTVSPTYAREIATPQYGMGLESMVRLRGEAVVGILNGVDYDEWNPQTDPYLPAHYDARNLAGKERIKKALLERVKVNYARETPLIGLVSRLTVQKGIDLLFEALPRTLATRNYCFVALGSGEPHYEDFFERLVRAFPGRVAFYRGYSEEFAHLIEAGSDMFLMPSLYEPCGLNQMYSLRYGTVPIVRRTGGLADSVQIYDPHSGEGTGIVFDDYNVEAVSWAITTAVDLFQNRRRWNRILRNGLAQNFSWDRQGGEYIALYEKLMKPVPV